MLEEHRQKNHRFQIEKQISHNDLKDSQPHTLDLLLFNFTPIFMAKDRIKDYGSVTRRFHNVVTAAETFVKNMEPQSQQICLSEGDYTKWVVRFLKKGFILHSHDWNFMKF